MTVEASDEVNDQNPSQAGLKHYTPINCMPHLPLLGKYLGHTWGFDHESRPEGGAFDHMIIKCYSIYGGARWEI